MLRAGLACAEKVPEFDGCHFAAGRQIGLVQNKRAPIVVPAEEPSVTIFTVIDFSLAIRHLRPPLNQPMATSNRSIPPAGAQDSFSALVAASRLLGKDAPAVLLGSHGGVSKC